MKIKKWRMLFGVVVVAAMMRIPSAYAQPGLGVPLWPGVAMQPVYQELVLSTDFMPAAADSAAVAASAVDLPALAYYDWQTSLLAYKVELALRRAL